MARALRIQYPGALYHITSRGNARKEIFYDDRDRKVFLSILKDVLREEHWLCHAYCLMDNHYHLLVETLDPTLSRGMRQLNGIYTQKFHWFHGSVGHIFQGRFKAMLIEKETYFLAAARYIVLNPVRANMVKRPDDYRWSSYRATAGMGTKPSWLTTGDILSKFSTDLKTGQSEYGEFVKDGIGESSPFQNADGVILGSLEYQQRLFTETMIDDNAQEISKTERFIGCLPIGDIFRNIKSKYNRNIAIVSARIRYGYSGAEIGRYLNLHYSTVCKILKNSRFKT